MVSVQSTISCSSTGTMNASKLEALVAGGRSSGAKVGPDTWFEAGPDMWFELTDSGLFLCCFCAWERCFDEPTGFSKKSVTFDGPTFFCTAQRKPTTDLTDLNTVLHLPTLTKGKKNEH